MDVNAILYAGDDPKEIAAIRTKSSLNVKRPVIHTRDDWTSPEAQSPYFILDAQETKTTWHPIGT
jgi:hypothetical protein